MNYAANPPVRDIRLIPFVCGAGSSLPGCEEGPVAAKTFGLEKQLSDAHWQADPEKIYERERAFYKNLPALGTVARDEIVLRNCIDVSNLVEAVVKDGAMPVTIGGDHSIAAGSIAGFARATGAHGRIGVVWIDAHADIHTPDTSDSKAQHGMPVASLMGLGNGAFDRIGGDVPVVSPAHFVYAGLRSKEPAEDDRIEKLSIQNFPIENFSDELFLKSVDAIAAQTDYLVYSIDLDAFDPSVAPAVGTPEQNGFGRDHLLALLKKLVRRHTPDMIEVVEFNPGLPGAEQTYKLMREVLEITLRI